MTNPDSLASYKLSPAEPRSFKSSLRNLPGQYIKVLFKPTPRTFALEAERANWGMVWFQLLILIIMPLILGLIRGLDHSLTAQVATRSRFVSDILVAFSFGA